MPINFDEISGSKFDKSVWRELLKIPFGETRSYKDIARNIGNINASRAIGNANAKNPLPFIIPCHRVIRADKNIGGYALGVKLKARLLKLENVTKC